MRLCTELQTTHKTLSKTFSDAGRDGSGPASCRSTHRRDFEEAPRPSLRSRKYFAVRKRKLELRRRGLAGRLYTSAGTDRPDHPNLGVRASGRHQYRRRRADLRRATPLNSLAAVRVDHDHSQLHVVTSFARESFYSTFLFAPPSQLRSRSKLAVCGGLMAIISSVAITAAIATGGSSRPISGTSSASIVTTELASWLSRPTK